MSFAPLPLHALPTALAAVGATPTPSDGATSDVQQAVDEVAATTVDVLSIAWKVGLGALIGIVVAFVVVVALRTMGRHRAIYSEVSRYCRNATYMTCALLGAYLAGQVAVADISTPGWALLALHGLLIALIAAVTWLVVGLAKAVEATIVTTTQAAGDEGRANRVRTQTEILRRVAEVVILIAGTVAVVMTFPAARIAMGSLLASAGLVSVIAGLAAQSTLGNIFAGIQLAATDAIRVDDVVVVDGEQGNIEEITLTYVVVHVWDDRRLIYPSTYFTENPFANWSRRGTQHIGTLTIDLDWRVPVTRVRAELARVVAGSRLWDGRTADLDVTDTSGGSVTLRIALSGANPADVFGLQCHVREELLAWLQREAPYSLPRTRVEVDHVDVTHDPEPERVARLAEELVALQQPTNDPEATAALSAPGAVPPEDDPIGAARVRAATRGRASLRRSRRDKVRRRRILRHPDAEAARSGEAGVDTRRAPGEVQDVRGVSRRGSEDATRIITAQEQEAYLEQRRRAAEAVRRGVAGEVATEGRAQGAGEQGAQGTKDTQDTPGTQTPARGIDASQAGPGEEG